MAFSLEKIRHRCGGEEQSIDQPPRKNGATPRISDAADAGEPIEKSAPAIMAAYTHMPITMLNDFRYPGISHHDSR